MQNFFTPLKVGVLTVASIVAFWFGISQVTKSGLDDSSSYVVSAIFDDASGLRQKSRVQIAGIEVGQINSIELVGSKAKVVVRIRNEVALYEDARVSKRSEGFIGDMSLDIWPGSEKFPRLVNGGAIKDVVSVGDMEKIFATLKDVTVDIQAVTSALRQMLAGDDVGGIKKIIDEIGRLTESVNVTISESGIRLKSILEDVQKVTSSVTDLASGETDTIAHILHNIDKVSMQLQDAIADVRGVLGTVKGVLGTSEGELKDGVAGVRQSLDKLNSSLDQVNQVTTSLAAGKGTLGRLLVDDTLIREVEETVGDASDFIDRLIKLQTEVTLVSEFHMNKGSSREHFGLRLMPAEDKWYEVGLISPPQGVPVFETIDLIADDGSVTTTTTRTTNKGLSVNLLFAHRWRFGGVALTGKFGLIESSGGLAGEAAFFGDHLSLGIEAFEFSSPDRRYPKLRAFATWSIFNHLYLRGGVDDALNATTIPPAGASGATADRFRVPARDIFVGAGFYFTDEDLKSLLTTMGVPKIN